MKLIELYARRHELLFKKEYARAPWYAKAVTHRVTPFFVWSFERWGVTPNQTTFLSLVVGIFSAGCFSSPDPYWVLTGALALELYYVLDSVDGQLARLTKNFSKTGSFFDMIGNYIIHPLVYAALGIAQAAAGHGSGAVWLGVLAALGSLWLGVLWDVRGHVIYFNLRKDGASKSFSLAPQPASEPPSPPQPRFRVGSALFSIIHKFCTYPYVMSLLTTAGILGAILQTDALIWPLLVFWGVCLPAVALFKIAKTILARDVDREYESWRST